MKLLKQISYVLIFAIFVMGTLYVVLPEQNSTSNLVDDWEFDPEKFDLKDLTSSFGSMGTLTKTTMAMESIGFSVGGAKDINNFRKNINDNFLPLETDITYEGLFYDYYFDTNQQECSELFCPSYSYALTQDPFSQEDEYYMTVGLNSGIQNFERKKLNLIVVMDISGSMGSPFNQYYYDQFWNKVETKEQNDKSKMKVASESTAALLSHLNDYDRFGMVVFDDQGFLAKPLNKVGETDMTAIKDHVLELKPRGGTNMEAGMLLATEQFSQIEKDPTYENRIIFLTDAMPNRGVTDEHGLLGMTKSNAQQNLHTTFIGIGVDFNTELIEEITKIRGANYYSVHSSMEFSERMDEQFEFMVTPLVFDLQLSLESDGFEIAEVYGSPEANKATGKVLYVNTLFPSKTEDGETKGGIVLVKLKKVGKDEKITLTVQYEDRKGVLRTNKVESSFTLSEKSFNNTGIRKGILLTQYANLMKNWIHDERANVILPAVNHEDGIVAPVEPILGKWERQSKKLTVSSEYQKLFAEFTGYFEGEAKSIGDLTLHKELRVLRKLQ